MNGNVGELFKILMQNMYWNDENFNKKQHVCSSYGNILILNTFNVEQKWVSLPIFYNPFFGSLNYDKTPIIS